MTLCRIHYVWSESLCLMSTPNLCRLQAAMPQGKHMLEHSFKRIVSGQLQQTRQKASMGRASSEKAAGAPQAWSTGELQQFKSFVCPARMTPPACCQPPGTGGQLLSLACTCRHAAAGHVQGL